MMKNLKCPKCNGEMEAGTVKGENALDGKELWQSDTSEKIHNVHYKGKYVKTYRCKECGYLESYAE